MRKSKSPYESHGREATCAICLETKDEKAVKIFIYRGKNSGNEIHLNVCRSCENKKEKLEQIAIDHFKTKCGII